MNNPINILDALQQETPATLEVIKVTESEIALIPFTSNAESLDLHYCSETEISSYVHCLGTGWLLCQVGRKKDPRLLLPVYLPTANAVGVLPLSRSLRPFALLPQLGPILQANKPMVAFVRREGVVVLHKRQLDGRLRQRSLVIGFRDEPAVVAKLPRDQNLDVGEPGFDDFHQMPARKKGTPGTAKPPI